MIDLRKRLGNERLFCDGASGSMLQSFGLATGELPERWNLTHPDEIEALARLYFEAGADIVNANTFGANALKYGDELEEIVTAAVTLAKRGRAAAGREDGYVALDMGPTGRLLAPLGDLAFDDAVALFGETARIGAKAGADLILIETMTECYEARAAVLGAREQTDLPVLITMSFDEGGRLLSGTDIETAVAIFEGLGVDAIGLNCGLGPEQMMPLAKRLIAAASIPVIVNPNAGLPRIEDGRAVYDVDPAFFASCMQEITAAGAQIIGGCCGTTPAHIEEVVKTCRDLPFAGPVKKEPAGFCSYSRLRAFDGEPVVIGRLFDADTDEDYWRALREGDTDLIVDEALELEDEADAVEIATDHPGVDGTEMLCACIRAIQEVTTMPLSFCTADPQTLEAGLRIYNGRALVRLPEEGIEPGDAWLDVVRRYGAIAVRAAGDEDGVMIKAERMDDGKLR